MRQENKLIALLFCGGPVSGGLCLKCGAEQFEIGIDDESEV